MKMVLLAAMAAGALSAADFGGRWGGTIAIDGRATPFALTINQQDGKISGSIATLTGERLPMEKLEVDGDRLAFEVRDEAGRIVKFRLTLTAAALSGESTTDERTSWVVLTKGPDVDRIGREITAPRLIRKVEPEYSEEGRKAKFEGTVILYAEIDPDGVPQNIRVRHGVGLGLDEKAVEAVRKWRFKPGLKEGRPVTVAATIQVSFRL
jgi:TonB family protein